MNLSIYFSDRVKNALFLKKECEYYFSKVFKINPDFINEKKQATLVFDIIPDKLSVEKVSINLKRGEGQVVSNSEIGLVIAFYKLFKVFGVRYLRPGKKNEILPDLNFAHFIEADINIDEKASFKHRGVCIEGADSFENVCNFIDWLPKIGMNSFFIQFENPYSFLKRWYDHEFNPYIQKEEFSNEIAEEMSNKIDMEIHKRSLRQHRVGHGWTGEVLGYSSKFGWESGIKLPEEKKPLVAELNGERELYDTAPILTSLDFSNPEVGNKMVELIVAYAKERKDVDYLHVWLSDARNNICECSKCQKALPSDQYVRILNQLDSALTREKLETKICFLLYHELLFAPQKEEIKNPDRFTMMFAPITRTFEKSYADVDYDQGIPTPNQYIRNKIILPNSLEENLSYLFSWQKCFGGDSFVYDYPLGRAHYGDLGYMKISQVISRDIKYLDRINLGGYISCQELRAGFPHNFPNYVMGEVLWDKNINYEELLADYFSNLYGSDWHTIVQYLEQLSTYSSCDHFNAIGNRINPKLSLNYKTVVHLAQSSLSLIEKNISEHDGFIKEQWIQLGYHREYVIKLATSLALLSEGSYELSQIFWRDFVDFIRRNEEKIQNNLDVYRVIEVAKNYAGFSL
ncbi:DUF4838 domain-containing protein [Enterococcus sp. 5B3_DIV0040]|uniref:DUF4838 domain-containing protein n=1 Tax=Enterococcus sp. 5B3_DIV0040 TaxID=1834182 RepID=UPI000A34E715|nr:DUF4838 domain-containing protein [Enterococcus sp. 5B3_DIV0040]OTO05303.1 hypothetical protein A5883_002295 [Enterococcus sp. 5B3_DIV0040]